MRRSKRIFSNAKTDKKELQKNTALIIDVEALTYYPAIETKTNSYGNARKEEPTKIEGRRKPNTNSNTCNGKNRKERQLNLSRNESSSTAPTLSSSQPVEQQNPTTKLLENDEDVILKYIESSSEERINYTMEHVTDAVLMNKYHFFSGQNAFSEKPQLV